MERPDKNIETADILRSAVRDGGRRARRLGWGLRFLRRGEGGRLRVRLFLALGVILTETQCKSRENVI